MNKHLTKAAPKELENGSAELSQDQRPLVLLVFGLILIYSHLFGWSPPDWHGMRITHNISSDSIFVWLSGSRINDGLYRTSKALLPPIAENFDTLYIRVGIKPPPVVHAFSIENTFTQNEPKAFHTALAIEDSLPPIVIPAPPQMALFYFQPISINRANKELLVTLPGIGQRLAERIMALREEKGAFQEPAELLAVSGISRAKLDRFAKHLSFK